MSMLKTIRIDTALERISYPPFLNDPAILSQPYEALILRESLSLPPPF
jgi:hypothetical protein